MFGLPGSAKQSGMNILVIGGTRFFGKRLVKTLINERHEVTLLTRGRTADPFGNDVQRIHCDRRHAEALASGVRGKAWDAIVDQVCMNAAEARAACEIFSGHANLYVFTSSQSVYPPGAGLKEEAFDPKSYKFSEAADERNAYAEAKRQAESVFANCADFRVAMVRFPIVLGEDDYTRRLHFHIDRVRDGKPIFFPNLRARIGFIQSEDAAEALYQIIQHRLQGPVNVASKTPISLKDLIFCIEAATNKTAEIAASPGADNCSPFGIEDDWYMNVDKAAANNIAPVDLDDWLPALVKRIAQTKR